MSTAEQRFFAKVTKTPICWLWTAARSSYGHGVFATTGRHSMGAHRWSYEYHIGPIPAGLEIDHLCRVTRCVNPAHLEAVTGSENTRRARRAKALLGDRPRAINLNWPGFIAEFRSIEPEREVAA